MRRPPSLQRRIMLAVLGAAAASTLTLATVAWFGQAWIEETVLARSQEQELAFLVERGVAPEDVNPHGGSLRYFRPARSVRWRVPVELLALPPGDHHDVAIGDRSFQVLVRDIAPDDRAYLVSDIGDVERRERFVQASLAAGVLLALGLALLVGRQIAGISLQPFRELLRRIAALDPRRPEQPLKLDGEYSDLAPIARVLNAHIAALAELLRHERAFAAAAGHELRTPLAVIASAAELHEADPSTAAVACARIRRAVADAGAMLDALMALSQLRELPPRSPQALHELLPPLAELHAPGAKLEWRLQPAIWPGARGVAAVIFTNLLRNAVQADRGGRIEIELAAGALSVRDHGRGLDPAVAQRAFEPGVSGREGGSGMGLYVARTLARRYGGDVTLEAADGGARAVWRFGAEGAPAS